MRTKYHLNGKEINLTSEDIIIKSNNFNVDKSGNLTCNNAQMNDATMDDATMNNVTINGGNIELEESTSGGTVRFRITGPTSKMYITSEASHYGDECTVGVYGDGGGFLSCTKNGSTSTSVNYSGITTPKLTQTSLESEKKNFVKFNNALDIIKQVDIYKYNLKDEKDTDKKHIGFVIGENYNYSKELTSKENNGADIYSLASCCLQAIKEQQIEIEKLKNKIKKMEVK